MSILQNSRLETDAFCAGCGYNLHGQDVWPDDRLGLLVCRCPECGKHHPAGFGTSASSVWLKRLATLVLVLWIAIVLGAAGLLTLTLGWMQGAYVGVSTSDQMMTLDGRPVEYGPLAGTGNYGYVDQKTRKPIDSTRLRNRLVLQSHNDVASYASDERIAGWTLLLIESVALGIGSLVGLLLSTALWHWPRRAYWAGCAFPLLAWIVATIIYCNVDQYELIRRWATERALMVAGIECVGVLIGARLGRPVARSICRIVVPPKPRMLLAFLWHADGKTMPATPEASCA